MTMSCEAEPNAISMASSAMTVTSAVVPQPARARTEPMSTSWQTRIQDRRGPIGPNRGANRSISGDHRNLKVHGAWASEKSPTVRMSTPR